MYNHIYDHKTFWEQEIDKEKSWYLTSHENIP